MKLWWEGEGDKFIAVVSQVTWKTPEKTLIDYLFNKLDENIQFGLNTATSALNTF